MQDQKEFKKLLVLSNLNDFFLNENNEKEKKSSLK